jgi:two-component system NtrC family sensor kinase
MSALAELQSLLGERPEAQSHLEALRLELSHARAMESRLQEISDALFALASLDFSRPPIVRDDGTAVDAAAACVAMLGEELSAHLTERQRIAEQLLNAEKKMASIGQLAAGVAHEINNPLGVILLFAQGLQRRLEPSTSHFEKPVTSIIREALRCKVLVEQLLSYARTAPEVRVPLDVTKVLTDSSELLKLRANGQKTQIELQISEPLSRVMGNASQLEQVVMNLGFNAIDALGSGGKVLLKVDQPDPTCVAIRVVDDGPGIPEPLRARIFEPFFSTKPAGKGTGLGLSVCMEIVHQHGGALEVHSEVGRGTTMSVRLPALRSAA